MTIVIALFQSTGQVPAAQDSIYVTGEVVHPGMFRVQQGQRLSISQAIALAGGFTKTARQERVEIIRNTANGQRENTVVDVRAVLSGAVPDVALNPNDVVYVPGRIEIRRVTDHWPILIAK